MKFIKGCFLLVFLFVLLPVGAFLIWNIYELFPSQESKLGKIKGTFESGHIYNENIKYEHYRINLNEYFTSFDIRDPANFNEKEFYEDVHKGDTLEILISNSYIKNDSAKLKTAFHVYYIYNIRYKGKSYLDISEIRSDNITMIILFSLITIFIFVFMYFLTKVLNPFKKET